MLDNPLGAVDLALSTVTYPNGYSVTTTYNDKGYRNQLSNGLNILQTLTSSNAFGQITGETYGNGVNTQREYDPLTGSLTHIGSSVNSATLQNNDYAWQSNGVLESRIAHPVIGITSQRQETFSYDIMNRVKAAETYINGSNTRDLNYSYNGLGNLTSKTSTQAGDNSVTGYSYGAGSAGADAVTHATINGTNHTLHYDANGAITRYDIAGTSTDKYITYNSFNQPTKIVVGTGLNDSAPQAIDQFKYDPDGNIYQRDTSWTENGNSYTESVVYIGAYELSSEIHPTKSFSTEKVKVGSNIIRIDSIELDLLGNASEHSGVEYAHRDHLGSIEAVTNDVGAVMDYMAYEPFGARKSKHWTQNLGSAESTSLLLRTLAHDRKVRGFTDHQHLDRTGFIHMKGRVYDPVLGRFLSPDPIVQAPTNSQSWNRYSYVFNSPLVYTDPSGYCAATGHNPLAGQNESITTCYKSPSPAQQDFNDFLSGQEDDWQRWEQERNATYGYNVPPIQIQLPELPKGDPYKEGGSCESGGEDGANDFIDSDIFGWKGHLFGLSGGGGYSLFGPTAGNSITYVSDIWGNYIVVRTPEVGVGTPKGGLFARLVYGYNNNVADLEGGGFSTSASGVKSISITKPTNGASPIFEYGVGTPGVSLTYGDGRVITQGNIYKAIGKKLGIIDNCSNGK